MTFNHIDNTLRKIEKLETELVTEHNSKRQSKLRKKIDKLYTKIRTSKEAIDNLDSLFYINKFKLLQNH